MNAHAARHNLTYVPQSPGEMMAYMANQDQAQQQMQMQRMQEMQHAASAEADRQHHADQIVIAQLRLETANLKLEREQVRAEAAADESASDSGSIRNNF